VKSKVFVGEDDLDIDAQICFWLAETIKMSNST